MLVFMAIVASWAVTLGAILDATSGRTARDVDIAASERRATDGGYGRTAKPGRLYCDAGATVRYRGRSYSLKHGLCHLEKSEYLVSIPNVSGSAEPKRWFSLLIQPAGVTGGAVFRDGTFTTKWALRNGMTINVVIRMPFGFDGNFTIGSTMRIQLADKRRKGSLVLPKGHPLNPGPGRLLAPVTVRWTC